MEGRLGAGSPQGEGRLGAGSPVGEGCLGAGSPLGEGRLGAGSPQDGGQDLPRGRDQNSRRSGWYIQQLMQRQQPPSLSLCVCVYCARVGVRGGCSVTLHFLFEIGALIWEECREGCVPIDGGSCSMLVVKTVLTSHYRNVSRDVFKSSLRRHSKVWNENM